MIRFEFTVCVLIDNMARGGIDVCERSVVNINALFCFVCSFSDNGDILVVKLGIFYFSEICFNDVFWYWQLNSIAI